MATVIFDFDSTLIHCESLEEILRPKLADNPGSAAEIDALTKLGMEGQLDFHQSLSRRLAIAAPTLADVKGFADKAPQLLTVGMEGLVAGLLTHGINVRIVSGGLVEAILPTARHLGLAAEQVHAVQLKWDHDGFFAGLDPDDPFSFSKLKGIAPLVPEWSSPLIAVGDGMTDYALYEQGMVDHFIGFVGHVRRSALIAKAEKLAEDVPRLTTFLEEIL